MDSRKRKLVAVAMVVVLVASVAVVAFTVMNKAGFKASVTDAAGRSVELDSEPQRIVSGSPAITEIVCGLGLSDKLVAVTKYCDYPAEAKALVDDGKVIGGFWNPSFEMVVSFEPDLVLLNSRVDAHNSLATQLEDANITVVMLYPQENLEEVYKSIDLVGAVTGTGQKATQIINSMKAQISDVEAKVATEPTAPGVLFISYVQAGMTDIYAAGGDTAVDEVIGMAGGSNVLAAKSGWYSPSSEEMMMLPQEIDCLIITIMYSTESPQNTTDFLRSDPLWKESPAVKNNKVYFLTGQAESIFNRQSLRMTDAVQLLAQILHPDVFSNDVPYSPSGINLIGDEYVQYLDQGTAAQSSMVTVTAICSRD